MNISALSVVVFQTIPECIALVFLTLVLLKEKANWNIILFLGILQAAAVYYIRMLPLEFGVHTVILMLVLTVLIAFIFRIKFVKALVPVIASFIVLISFEVAAISTVMSVADVNLDMLATNDLLRIAVLTPQWILLFLTGFIIQYFRRGVKTFQGDIS